MPKATIDDVAGLAGVSIKTVSRVVNAEPNVRQATRERVLNAVRALNYRPNASARSLAGDRSYLIGLLYDNPSANYVTDLQYGVLAACREQHYDLLIHPCNYKHSGICEEVVGLVAQSKMDGVLLTPPLSDTETVVAALQQARIPFVSIAPRQSDEGAVCVATDDHQAAFAMTEHLIALGHREIGFISGHPDHRAMARRLEGYREALRAFDVQPQQHLVVQGYNSFESGEACARQLLLRKEPPSAIFASNDDMAAGVMMVAHQMGIAIPAGLSVAGFDDTPIARQIWPPLTTVQQPIKAMAETAAQILIGRLRGQTEIDTAPVIPSQLVIRQSTAVLP
ncbi:LacI family transcriptional regulator [Exilibacterium tricleocarpae]|uniref:LacI family transcriptional regulator n=1 Tax=Exilibacterium tricleocarpae TaxID=2591008 RepID=A0A545U706_9GAMM|nr:LacI family DNA-binding transcriptional regulator [Exilibacterium tricleocarpae]TQV85246.1 LacI family transcriptional regulator [Exilibacterium tricleocarpae]